MKLRSTGVEQKAQNCTQLQGLRREVNKRRNQNRVQNSNVGPTSTVKIIGQKRGVTAIYE